MTKNIKQLNITKLTRIITLTLIEIKSTAGSEAIMLLVTCQLITATNIDSLGMCQLIAKHWKTIIYINPESTDHFQFAKTPRGPI